MVGTGVVNSIVGILGLGRIGNNIFTISGQYSLYCMHIHIIRLSGQSIAEKIKGFHPAKILYHNRKPVDKYTGK